ncbi:MAG TPA: hypothetical protein PK536_12775 [Ignavibacteria bacterium]|nr:hypothetical protein [Bacteroidota bacterium]HRI86312.1 hypothetical protein [Ignavibacteria bacterium]HRK00478.1 hypothetical protein [Ignavibacteria bacterium]
MENTILMGFFREEDLHRGVALWRGKYFEQIKKFNTLKNIELIKPDDRNVTIAYLLGKDNNDEKCYRLQITDTAVNADSMKVNFIVEGKTDYDSAYLKNAVWNYIPKEKLDSPFIPLCITIEKDAFDRLIEDNTLISEINKLKKKSNWLAIYNLAGDMNNLKENELLWNNETILDGFSFASAKLSETYINLKQTFRSDDERNAFLKKQKKYRENTTMLRKRCIELNPGKASYYSNLGYSYYQYARELMMPGGRRDGKITDDAKLAIEYIDKALEKDPQRIPDLYRKGQLLSVIMPPQILFGGKNSPGEDAVKESKEKITEGIEAFKKIEDVWQILPLLEDKRIKRYHKEYVKALYNIAGAYAELAGDEWNIAQYLLPLKFENSNKEISKYSSDKIALLDKALDYMDKCAAADNIDFADKFPPPSALTLCRFHGVEDGNHKLYSMGKYYFQKYLILTSCDEGYLPEAELYRKNAEDFLKAAMRYYPKKGNERQSKNYIAEKLARIYISKGEYEKAVDILRNYINDRTAYYIKYTYSAACILSGKYIDAEKQTNSALKNSRGNFEIWLGYFLLYVKCLKENNFEEAEKFHKLTKDTCIKGGRKSPSGLLIGQAFVSYKSGNRQEAVRLLREAEKLDPFRKGIRKKILNWSQN